MLKQLQYTNQKVELFTTDSKDYSQLKTDYLLGGTKSF